jgi:hypothetical protein
MNGAGLNNSPLDTPKYNQECIAYSRLAYSRLTVNTGGARGYGHPKNWKLLGYPYMYMKL